MDSAGLAALSGLGIVVVNQTTNLIREWAKNKRDDEKAEAIAIKLATLTDKQTVQVLDKIQENTTVNLDQISVGNGYNAKFAEHAGHIAALHDRMDAFEYAARGDREILRQINEKLDRGDVTKRGA